MPIANAYPTPFDDALSSLRIEGSILLHGYHSPPWSVQVPDGVTLREYLGFGSNIQVIPFHLVLSGAIHLAVDAATPFEITTGEVILCLGGMAHRMFAGEAQESLAFIDVLRARSANEARCGGPPGAKPSSGTEMLCGFFAIHATPLNPLMAALPSLLRLQTQGPQSSPRLISIIDMLKLELTSAEVSEFATSRLLEILCAEIFIAQGTTASRQQAGWFTGLLDPQIGKALAQIHRAPHRPWTVRTLAAEVAMSHTRFAARFRELTGQTVMSYVTAWRMNGACRMLLTEHKGLSDVAARAGYGDVAAFSRAFKTWVGVSPAHWRKANAQNTLTSSSLKLTPNPD